MRWGIEIGSKMSELSSQPAILKDFRIHQFYQMDQYAVPAEKAVAKSRDVVAWELF